LLGKPVSLPQQSRAFGVGSRREAG
jgi:hypothetical protein